MADQGAERIHAELSRDLGLVSALAIGTGTMIAAGIFTLSGLAVGYVGSAAILSFFLAAVVASCTALSYCEFTSIYPESGEGYLYARKTFAPPVAYLVGWLLVLGYTSSCGFYIASLSVYFNEFIWHLPIEQLSGLVMLGALTLLNIKGTKESGSFQVLVTIAKILLLVWFIWGGLDRVDLESLRQGFESDISLITSTSALVFITFFGFSAIAASAGDIQRPTRNVPLAIFVSMAMVTILYSLVVLVIVAADLSEYTEAAMGVAARDFLGPIGGMVIIGGALFSMISASNASILAGSRVALSMSRLRHLPIEIGAVSAQTGTPAVALLLVGISIASFTLVLPLESLAHFADCVLLLALTMVNIALIYHRRQYPDVKRPFRVPLVPLIPGVGILANIYLLIQIPLQGHIQPVVLAALCLVAGFFGFLAWKGTEFQTEVPLEPPSRVLLERASTSRSGFRVLLPVANPATAKRLVDIASAIVVPQNGEIVSLRVVRVPEQLLPTIEESYVEQEEAILSRVRRQALEHQVAVSSQVRIGRNVGRAILETARERRCQLIVLGWKGHTSTARRMLGDVTDHVVNNARADIMLVKLVEQERPLKRLLLPSAGGIHAVRAQRYADYIADSMGASLTLCAVIPTTATNEDYASQQERLQSEADEHIQQTKDVQIEIIRHGSVSEGIVELAKDYDAIIVGAAGQSFSTQILFGGIPEEIARLSDLTVIVVKQYHPVKELMGRVMTE